MRARLVQIFILLSSIAIADPTVFATGERVPTELIVKYKSHSGGISKSSSGLSSSRSMIRNSFGKVDVKPMKGIGVDRVKLNGSQNLSKSVAEIGSHPDVEYVEPNYWVKAISSEPASTGPEIASSVWGLTNISVEEAWEITTGSRDTVVAVIDSGVDVDHVSLADNIWLNPGETDIDGSCIDDGIDNDGNGYVDDCYGWNFADNNNDLSDGVDHGTHVAGIIGGINASKVYGVNFDVSLMVVKFISNDGWGTTADAIASIVYAVNNGAKVLNNSWGGADYSRALKDAIEYSHERGALFVAASGNDGMNNDVVKHYPSNYAVPNVLSVGASSESNRMVIFSNFGSDSVDVVAPGVGINSTISNDYYDYMSGTSMATPFVAGIAALVLTQHPNMSGYDLKRVLMESSDYFSSLNDITLTGGRVNASEALSLAASGLTSSPKFPMMPQLPNPNEAKDVISPVGCGRVETSKTNSTDIQMMVVLLVMPLTLIVMKKRRKRSVAKMGNIFCRYFLQQ